MQRLLVTCTLLLAGQSARGLAADAAPDLVFPGKTWATKTPGEAGMDPEKLRALSSFVGGHGCVVRRGYMVYTWGDVGRRADVASAAKPFYSFFLFKAIEDGKIKSVDAKVVEWEPRLAGGVWEIHVRQPYDRPLSAWQPAWTEIGGARAFMETLPFWEMEPNNTLVKSGRAFCLAKPGQAYALYLPIGGSVTIELAPRVTYEYAWWNPANGKDGSFQDGGRIDGGTRQFLAPGQGDWALRIARNGP